MKTTMSEQGKLMRHKDSWDRVDSINGDPIFISIAQSGVLVRRSHLGFLGAKLCDEDNIYRAARKAEALDKEIKDIILSEMTNPVLRAFTKAAMKSSSAAELTILLNESGVE